jgi:hypothetical protein
MSSFLVSTPLVLFFYLSRARLLVPLATCMLHQTTMVFMRQCAHRIRERPSTPPSMRMHSYLRECIRSWRRRVLAGGSGDVVAKRRFKFHLNIAAGPNSTATRFPRERAERHRHCHISHPETTAKTTAVHFYTTTTTTAENSPRSQ